MTHPRARQASALSALFDETRALFHRLRAAAAAVHGQGEMTAARRGVLTDLARFGPRTVPQMARSRPVSRQHIQAIVNGLVADGLVELVTNPAHQRSHLVRLTKEGTRLVDAMGRRERHYLDALDLDVSETDVRTATNALRSVREALESVGVAVSPRGPDTHS